MINMSRSGKIETTKKEATHFSKPEIVSLKEVIGFL